MSKMFRMSYLHFCEFLCNFVQFGSVFLFLHWNPSLNLETLHFYTICHTLVLLIFAEFADHDDDVYAKYAEKFLHYLMSSATTSRDVTFCTIWHLTRRQYGFHRSDMWVLQLEYAGFYHINVISWILISIIKVSMYLGIICRPVSEPLGCSLVNFPSCWFKVVSWTGSSETGCKRMAVAQPSVVLSFCRLVWWFPRDPSKKIWSCFGGWWPVVVHRSLESQTTDRRNSDLRGGIWPFRGRQGGGDWL